MNIPASEHVEALPRLSHIGPGLVSEFNSLGSASSARGVNEGAQVVRLNRVDHAADKFWLSSQTTPSVSNDVSHSGEAVIADPGLLGVVDKANDMTYHRVDFGASLDLGDLGRRVDEKDGRV